MKSQNALFGLVLILFVLEYGVWDAYLVYFDSDYVDVLILFVLEYGVWEQNNKSSNFQVFKLKN